MRKSISSPAAKSKSRSLTKLASPALVDYLKHQYPSKVPISALTAASKTYANGRPLTRDHPTIARLAGKGNDIATSTLIDLLSSEQSHQKGKELSEEAVRRVYAAFANPEGKLTFDYVMKMGERIGVNVTQKMAKLIVKKYGKKDHLNVEDCLRVNRRRNSQSLQKDRR